MKILSLLLMLLWMPAGAQVVPALDRSQCPSYLMVMGTGVGTLQHQAMGNLSELIAEYGGERGGTKIEYKIAYARSGNSVDEASLRTDLIEAFLQWRSSQEGVSWSWFVPLLRGRVISPSIEPPENLWALLRRYGDSLVERVVGELRQSASEATRDFIHQYNNIYSPALKAGKRVVAVAHSQGNFFANYAYRQLAEDPTIGTLPRLAIVSVASPDSRVEGDASNTRYVRAPTDLIPLTVPGALPVNVEYTSSQVLTALIFDRYGHSFSRIYMNDELPNVNLVKVKIEEAFNSLPENCWDLQVDPSKTYLSSSAVPVTQIPLMSIGASGGSYLDFLQFGSFVYDPTSNPDLTSSSLTAVFGSNSSFIAPIDPYIGAPTPGCYPDISQDFEIFGSSPTALRIPFGATRLMFSTNDCPVEDNLRSGQFGVRIVVRAPNNF